MNKEVPPAYFVPNETVEEQTAEFNGVPLRVPVDTRAILRLALRLKQETSLRRVPIADIVDALAETTRRWQSPSFAYRQVAEEYLPKITGYSRPVIARGFDHLFSELSRDNLWALLEEEFDDPLVLDEWRPRRHVASKTRAFGPNLTLHIIAGNIPGIGVQSLIFGLLVKSPSMVKSATDEPLLTALFAQSLNEVAPEIARYVVVWWWQGGERERLLMGFSDLVVAYGGNPSIRAIRDQMQTPPNCRLVAYGHRYSLALIARECATRETAQALALDMAMYDQQGCLSPQFCWVEERGALSPQEFARALGNELEFIESELPSGIATSTRMANTQQVRAFYELKERAVYTSPRSTRWTVVFASVPTFGLPPAPRGISVLTSADFLKSALTTTSIQVLDTVQAIGLAAPPERTQAIVDLFAGQTGVNRFCPIGTMQFPPLLWHHDGRPNLTDFVRWVDWEE